MNKTNRILVLLAIWFTLFCAAVLAIVWHNGSEPIVLCGIVGLVMTYELRALLRLKLDKRAREFVKEDTQEKID